MPKANSSSATAQLVKEINVPHLENTTLKDDATCAVSSVMPDQSSLPSSTALLSKERNIPKLGNTVLKKDSVNLFSSSQNTQVGRSAQTISSAQPCARKEQDVGRIQLPFLSYHLSNHSDNYRSKPAASCSKQPQTDFERHWEDINLVRSDFSNQGMHRQKKPNLKRLRDQFNINSENAEHSRVVRTEQDHHPGKRFLTSESFLISAQDLLGVKPKKSGQEMCVPSTNVDLDQRDRRRLDVESLGSRDRRSNSTGTIWSAIEEECRDINRTTTTVSSAISTADIPHAGKTKYPQDLTRMSMDTLGRDIYMTDPAKCSVVDQRGHSHRFEKGGDSYDNDYSRSYVDESQLIRGGTKVTQATTGMCSKNSAINDQAISANDSVSRTEASHSEEKLSKMNHMLEKQPSRSSLELDRVYKQVNTSHESTHSQTSYLKENTDRHAEDQICNSRSEVPSAATYTALTSEVSRSSNYFPAQETQKYLPSSRDILGESSKSNPERELGISVVDAKENETTENARLQTDYSTDNTSPVQDTQSFTPSSRDLLVEGSSSSACESDNNIERNGAEKVGTNQTSDVKQRVDVTRGHSVPDNDRQSESDFTRRQTEQGNTTKPNEPENVRRHTESDENDVAKTCDSDAKTCDPVSLPIDPGEKACDQVAKTCTPVTKTCNPVAETCDAVAKTCDPVSLPCDPGAKTCDHIVKTCDLVAEICDTVAKIDATCPISHNLGERANDIEIIEGMDPNKTGADLDGKVIEDIDLVKLDSGKPEWITQYDAKKGQTVYVNVQSGNCTLERPDLSEQQSDGVERRMDFKDGASASSSVNACMTTTGKIQLLHSIPFPVQSQVCNDVMLVHNLLLNSGSKLVCKPYLIPQNVCACPKCKCTTTIRLP